MQPHASTVSQHFFFWPHLWKMAILGSVAAAQTSYSLFNSQGNLTKDPQRRSPTSTATRVVSSWIPDIQGTKETKAFRTDFSSDPAAPPFLDTPYPPSSKFPNSSLFDVINTCPCRNRIFCLPPPLITFCARHHYKALAHV